MFNIFFKRRIRSPKKDKLTKLEKSILDNLISSLPENESKKLNDQIKRLVLIRRIKYKNDTVTEFFPEEYGSIPKEFLFNRTEEFRLASIKFYSNGQKHTCEIFMVSGRIFDLKIKPIPSKKAETVTFENIKLEKELNKNLW